MGEELGGKAIRLIGQRRRRDGSQGELKRVLMILTRGRGKVKKPTSGDTDSAINQEERDGETLSVGETPGAIGNRPRERCRGRKELRGGTRGLHPMTWGKMNAVF